MISKAKKINKNIITEKSEKIVFYYFNHKLTSIFFDNLLYIYIFVAYFLFNYKTYSL